MSKLSDILYDETGYLPNKFTIALGKRIRDARLEIKMSQKELAKRTYLKQSSISKIEAGTRAVSAEDLLYLSDALEKPISYFFPEKYANEFDESKLSVLENELLIQIRQLSREDVRKLIAQARALVEFKSDAEREKSKAEYQEQFRNLVENATKKKEKTSRL